MTIKYKVVTYVEKKFANKYLQNIKTAKLNQIGNYINCISTSEVVSCWTSLEDANPTVGAPNTESVEREIRIELLVSLEDLERVISILKNYHPYETPEIDVYEIRQG